MEGKNEKKDQSRAELKSKRTKNIMKMCVVMWNREWSTTSKLRINKRGRQDGQRIGHTDNMRQTVNETAVILR